MENNRNSASYSSRAANSALSKTIDAYPPKRASYNRPTIAQPAPEAPLASAASHIMSTNTARPVAAPSPANGVARVVSSRRRQTQYIPPPTSGTADESIPAAPDVPRAPPTSYRDPYSSKTIARGPPVRSGSERSRDPAIQLNPSRQQATILSASDRLYHLRSPPYAPVEALTGNVQLSSPQRVPSVPDRSPLQKLEGKLDDISKEERRARILEAELAAQEAAEAERRARRAREASERQQRIVSQPNPKAEQPSIIPVRAASNKRHASMPIQHKPLQTGDLESEVGVPYDLSEPWNPATAQATPAPAPASAPLTALISDPPISHRATSQRQSRPTPVAQSKPQPQAAIAQNPNEKGGSQKGKELAGVSRGTGSFRDRSAGTPLPHTANKRTAAQTTGLGLVGVEHESLDAGITRMEGKRQHRDSRGIAAAQMEMEQEKMEQSAAMAELNPRQIQGLEPAVAPINRKSVTFSEHDNDGQPIPPEAHHRGIKGRLFHHDPERRYVPTPMLEEWKVAPLGCLTAEDLDLDAPVRSSGGGNKAWWEENQNARRRRSSGHAEPLYDGYVDEAATPTTFTPQLYMKCGPLLRYTGLRKDRTRSGQDREIWRGSVMIVTVDAQSSYSKPPTLRLFKQPMDILPPPPMEVGEDQLDPSYVDPIEGQIKISRTGKTLYVRPIDEIAENQDLSRLEDGSGLFSYTPSSPSGSVMRASRIRKRDGERLGRLREIPGVRLHTERGVTFWRFNLEIELGSSQARIAYRINRGPPIGFWVPARGESMNIVFHSCNGFSYGTESGQFCGPDPMWRDVLNTHQTRPFHVMIGGGDQIYNDAAMRETTLFRQWTESKNPIQKHSAPFTEAMQNELEQFYLDRYSMWFSQGLFGMANSQIPMVNIWDDHDIIDGFGSYPHYFMETPVFSGIGAVAFKYYMLFQHQSISAESEKTEPSWILGKSPGPYIRERSRSVFLNLGQQVAFLGLDCRTERQKDEILTEDSYDIVFDRLEDEIIKGETKHLIVLLGVPIAYPRLNFLETVLTSRLMDPIKALGRTGLLGNFVNKFDGGVEILDDLDDHWTAKHHKEERNWFIRELQHIASTKSVRVTILGGDVHLAAIGQFYTNKKLNIPKDKDHRYMPNVISSAIVNTPPPDMMADIINKRNKVHHLDPFTDEDMIPIFTHDVDGQKRNNNHLLPHRNWCSIREYKPGATPIPTPPESEDEAETTKKVSDFTPGGLVRRFSGTQTTRPPRRGRGPPLSYYNNPAYAVADEEQSRGREEPQSAFSPDRSEEPQKRPRSRRNSISSLFHRKKPEDNDENAYSTQSLPISRKRSSTSQDPPSTFHRRPSMKIEKGGQQQGEYVNLQGGLDICLNVEVSQHDPSGITTPYRLLVPALHYTAAEPGVVEQQARKPRGVFGVFGGKKRSTKAGDDGYSVSGSESGSELGEISDAEEEQTKQTYKVGPRIIIPGFGKRNKRNSIQSVPEKRLSSGFHTQNESEESVKQVDGPQTSAHNQTSERNHRQSVDAVPAVVARSSAWESVSQKRHSSAPQYYPSAATGATAIPARSSSIRKTPTCNSSHKSQLPAAPAPEPESKVYRKSMGGILNQHSHDKKWEHEAHVLAHAPSQKRSKRDSYPPHPAVVGGGPGSPYTRQGQGLQPRQDSTTTGDMSSSIYSTTTGGRIPLQNKALGNPEYDNKPPQRAEYAQRSGYDRTLYPSYPQRNGNAGVGAKYLGDGRYEDDEDDDYDSEEEEEMRASEQRRSAGNSKEVEELMGSQDTFEVPKKKKWQIWKK